MSGEKEGGGLDSVRTFSASHIDSSPEERSERISDMNDVILKFLNHNNEIEQKQSLGLMNSINDMIVSHDSNSNNDFDLNQAAGVILVEHIVKEVIEETKKLRDEISRQRPLLHCLNKIELRFGIANEAFGVSGPNPPPNEVNIQAFDEKDQNCDENSIEVISSIFDDSVEVEVELVKLHLHNCKPIPLRKMGKGILLVSNQVAETFYPTPLFAPEITILDKTGESSLFLHLYATPKTMEHDTEACIVGKIEYLSQADRIAAANNTYEENASLFTQYLLSGVGLNSPNAVFVPKLLKLQRNHTQEMRLLSNFVHMTKPTTTPNWHHVTNDFRRSVIMALGKKSDFTFLHENSKLKNNKEIISGVREMIDSVKIYHDGGCIVVRLSEGRLITNYRDDNASMFERRSHGPSPAWVLLVSENVLYSNIRSLNISVSGVEMGSADLYTSPGYNGQNKVHHCFNLNTMVKSIKSSEGHIYTVTEVVFWLDSIESTLNALGINVLTRVVA